MPAQRRRVSLVASIVLALAALFPHLLHAQDPVTNPREICKAKFLAQSAKIAGVLFQTFTSTAAGESCLRVSQDGKTLLLRTADNDSEYTLGQKPDAGAHIPAIPPGTDITGRGHPEVIVSEWTGGAHCCLYDYVYQVTPRFRLVATLAGADDDESHFGQLDSTGRWYFFTADWTFAYWYGSFAGSPVKEVVLQFIDDPSGGHYHLALDKVRRPAPSAEEWEKIQQAVRDDIAKIQQGYVSDIRSSLWQSVLYLIYTGQSDLAWKLIDEAGPVAPSGNNPTLSDFCGTLKTSPYWPDLHPSIAHMPKTCRDAKPSRNHDAAYGLTTP